MARKSGFDTRVILAAGVLVVGVFSSIGATHLGDVNLGAGDILISMSRGEEGLLMDIAPRSCPPHCGFAFDWRPRGF